MRTPVVALLASLACLAGCKSQRPLPGEEGAPKAVVLSLAREAARSEAIAKALNEKGYDVTRMSTLLPRAHSSMAIYDVHDPPERVDELTRLLHDDLAFPIDVFPFQQHATGGNAVVI